LLGFSDDGARENAASLAVGTNECQAGSGYGAGAQGNKAADYAGRKITANRTPSRPALGLAPEQRASFALGARLKVIVRSPASESDGALPQEQCAQVARFSNGR
jgi:hypothetical protein